MIGRGTRLAPGKERLVGIDIADNSRRHFLMSLATLFGLLSSFDLSGRDLLEADREIEETCEKWDWDEYGANSGFCVIA